ncbi:hypothetical protein B0I35DRAFT_423024 [Stachybotrys elegans]|uniref:Uncharacterized protein n=1 Tax=Stachybotrys elegans TaxID=80388 RepID=A0A8K0T092_9HYPO|nr:hypothetical protein B0I35DRAFT_423024 [Stachybotrys elegans]
MADQPQIIRTFQDGLKPYIKPREQVNYIRRVLALHLAANANGGAISYPWSLAEGSEANPVTSDLKGYQKEFVEALRAHTAARRQFDEVCGATGAGAPKDEKQDSPSEALEDRIGVLKLRQKQARLAEVESHFNLLVAKPAGTHGFLEPDQILDGVAPLPSVPKEVVNSLVAEQSRPQVSIKDRLNQLDKTVLRAKLLLKQQEHLLRSAKERSARKAAAYSHAERHEALSATRNELIAWIETELGKASTDGADEHHEENAYTRADRLTKNQSTVMEQLSEIKIKYQRYLACRRAVLSLVSERPQAPTAPSLQPGSPASLDGQSMLPIEYLLTPYIERLLSNSTALKSLITQKSHINAALAKQGTDISQSNRHLADESQLLPKYPMKDPSRRRSIIRDEVPAKTSGKLDLSNQIRPWVYAADSAKIATLEAVMENVEGGQVSLEGFMKNIELIDQMLGLSNAQDVRNKEASEEDVWLSAASAKDSKVRKHTDATTQPQADNDIWSKVNGKLGLISRSDK